MAIGADIKLSHSIFAMPFALLATFLAADGWLHWGQLVLIVLAMFFARTFAMLANRYLDRTIDADNPRTAGRALPAGRLTVVQVRVSLAACGFALILTAAGFGVFDENWLPLAFSPVVLLWLFMYGVMKRYTALCHFFLGAALAMSPVAAGLAINPASLAWPPLWLIAGFVLLWVAGFDIIYAMQDIDFDRAAGLHSVPARLGPRGALRVAKLAHVIALAMLILAWRHEARLGHLFLVGVCVVGLLLVIEHAAASRGRFSMAFFTVNGVISLLLGGLGIADVLL